MQVRKTRKAGTKGLSGEPPGKVWHIRKGPTPPPASPEMHDAARFLQEFGPEGVALLPEMLAESTDPYWDPFELVEQLQHTYPTKPFVHLEWGVPGSWVTALHRAQHAGQEGARRSRVAYGRIQDATRALRGPQPESEPALLKNPLLVEPPEVDLDQVEQMIAQAQVKQEEDVWELWREQWFDDTRFIARGQIHLLASAEEGVPGQAWCGLRWDSAENDLIAPGMEIPSGPGVGPIRHCGVCISFYRQGHPYSRSLPPFEGVKVSLHAQDPAQDDVGPVYEHRVVSWNTERPANATNAEPVTFDVPEPGAMIGYLVTAGPEDDDEDESRVDEIINVVWGDRKRMWWRDRELGLTIMHLRRFYEASPTTWCGQQFDISSSLDLAADLLLEDVQICQECWRLWGVKEMQDFDDLPEYELKPDAKGRVYMPRILVELGWYANQKDAIQASDSGSLKLNPIEALAESLPQGHSITHHRTWEATKLRGRELTLWMEDVPQCGVRFV